MTREHSRSCEYVPLCDRLRVAEKHAPAELPTFSWRVAISDFGLADGLNQTLYTLDPPWSRSVYRRLRRAVDRSGRNTRYPDKAALSANVLTRFAGIRLPRPASRRLAPITVGEASPIYL